MFEIIEKRRKVTLHARAAFCYYSIYFPTTFDIDFTVARRPLRTIAISFFVLGDILLCFTVATNSEDASKIAR